MEFTLTLSNQIHLFGKCWVPSEKPKLVIGLVHGLGEHMQRYGHLAAFLNRHQIALAGTDHQGHGQSEGKRGHTATIDSLIEEVEKLQDWMSQQFPGTPQMLYGHSMGGNILLNYLLRKQPKLIGAIASAAWIQLPNPPPAWMETIVRFLRKLFPALTIESELNTSYLSRDQAVVKAYKNDPLVHSKISTSTAVSLFDSATYIDTYSGSVSCPLLLMHGGDDQITNPNGSIQLADRLEGEVTLRIWEGFYHEIHNETEKEEVFEFILQWIEAQLRD